ncbi:MAG: dienelactone hydrolase family protein [Asticcacaulis sp.]
MMHLTRPEGSESEDFHLSRRGLAGLLFAGYALGAGPLRAQTITTDTDGLLARAVTIPAKGVQLPAYIAMPARARRLPVVIVVSEVFGLHEYIRDVCRRLAKAGYVAIAPDFFVRAGNPAALTDFEEIRKIVTTATHAQVSSDLQATLDWLKTNPDVGQGKGALGGLNRFADMNRIGITGFCWGGATVWMAVAENPAFKAGVAWYGRLKKPKEGTFLGDETRSWPLDVAPALKRPVLGLYAEKDNGIPLTDVAEMKDALAKSRSASHIVIYENAGHGFHADYRNAYSAEAAQNAWASLLEWFRKHL